MMKSKTIVLTMASVSEQPTPLIPLCRALRQSCYRARHLAWCEPLAGRADFCNSSARLIVALPRPDVVVLVKSAVGGAVSGMGRKQSPQRSRDSKLTGRICLDAIDLLQKSNCGN